MILSTYFRLLVVALALISLPAASPLAMGPDLHETSVNPGINDRWKSSDIDPLIETLESATRDIFIHRNQLAKLVNPSAGTVMADVGAGSGFMVEEFARMVGSGGMVYAVDINLKLLEQIEQRAQQQGLENVRTVLATDDSSRLAPLSIDLAFICDTYHHFEYPKTTMQTIYEALKPGGELVVIEFNRIPGESPDWVLEHVRGGKETFTREIVETGFHFVREYDASFVPRNYILRFKKP
jgi:ubiquinone/menaquinone biosynthesis C-methylase UbiE